MHKIEYESLQKLALVLLPIFVTSMGYVSMQIYNTAESLNKFPMIIEKRDNEKKKLSRKTKLISIITNILENSGNRIKPNRTPDYYIEEARNNDGKSELSLFQIELNRDIGKLYQFKDKIYYPINDMAYSINNILDIESKLLTKLKNFVDMHIDKPVTKIDKEKYYQEFFDNYLELTQALYKAESTNKIILEKNLRYQNAQSLKSHELINELDDISSALNIYLILFIINLLVLLILVSIAIRKPSSIYN